MSIVEYSAQVHNGENMKPCSIDSFDTFIVKFIKHIYIYKKSLVFFKFPNKYLLKITNGLIISRLVKIFKNDIKYFFLK